MALLPVARPPGITCLGRSVATVSLLSSLFPEPSTLPRRGGSRRVARRRLERSWPAGAPGRSLSTTSGSFAERLSRRLQWDPDSLVVADTGTFRRHALLPAAMLNHLCLGSIFAWSVFSQPLMRLDGVVTPASADWALGDISITFSLVMGGFAWGAVLGRQLDLLGPRVSCLVGACALTSGFSLASAAVALHNLPLLYVGGAVWGVANGWAYVPPVSTLVRWFPDRKGLASGLCILGYGGGAMVATPLFGALLAHFSRLPTFIGAAKDVHLVNQQGALFWHEPGGALREAVIATAADLKLSGLAALAEPGVYLVGTGATGVQETFAVMGLGYGAVMAATAFVFRLPPPDFRPASAVSAAAAAATASATRAAGATLCPEPAPPPALAPVLTTHNVSVHDAMRSRQFYLLYGGFGLSIVGTYGLLSSAKLMVSETFGSALPDVVTTGFTSTFVAAMSAANLSGRLVLPAASDALARARGGDPFFARRSTFTAMWAAVPFAYLGIVQSVHSCAADPSPLALAGFTASVLGILFVFGGTTAGRPALVADLYGLNSMGQLTARQLSVVLPAAYLGPQVVSHLRQSSTEAAIAELASKVDAAVFAETFGAGKEALEVLVKQKTVSVSKLLELLPPGVPDPTPFVYDRSMLLFAGCQLLACCTNLMLTPVVATAPAGHQGTQALAGKPNKSD
jgi:MFS family permease